jgi:hypothetical protein
MRVITGTAVFLVATAIGLGVVDSRADAGDRAWQRGLVVVLALLAAALVNRILFGRKYGWGDGECEVCRGFGKAFYGTGRHTYRASCRSCGGTGSGPGGPGRVRDREPDRDSDREPVGR